MLCLLPSRLISSTIAMLSSYSLLFYCLHFSAVLSIEQNLWINPPPWNLSATDLNHGNYLVWPWGSTQDLRCTTDYLYFQLELSQYALVNGSMAQIDWEPTLCRKSLTTTSMYLLSCKLQTTNPRFANSHG